MHDQFKTACGAEFRTLGPVARVGLGKILLPTATHLEERPTVSQSLRQAGKQSVRQSVRQAGRQTGRQNHIVWLFFSWGTQRLQEHSVVEWLNTGRWFTWRLAPVQMPGGRMGRSPAQPVSPSSPFILDPGSNPSNHKFLNPPNPTPQKMVSSFRGKEASKSKNGGLFCWGL